MTAEVVGYGPAKFLKSAEKIAPNNVFSNVRGFQLAEELALPEPT